MKLQLLFGVAFVATLALFGITAAQAASLHETVTTVADEPLPNVPGKRLRSVVVDYPPGAKSIPHRHAGSAFIYAYVLSGEIRSAVDDEPARIYRSGEVWFEKPGAHHVVSENASDTAPARLLATFIVDEADGQLTTPDIH
jgi:quercetin dioxygenase-like cupin family protein